MDTQVYKELKMPIDLDIGKMKEIASQLRCPSGINGEKMGKLLNQSNSEMIIESINFLNLEEKNSVLELGHGNCKHLKSLLNNAKHLKYFGMEISETMKEAAERINEVSIKKRKALFQMYDGMNIPYVANFFDKILSVNTIYFIKEPINFLNEIHRVLKPKGIFVLSLANSTFMKKLPFVVNSELFTLYGLKEIKNLINKSNFELFKVIKKNEIVKSKTGTQENRPYFIVVLRKKKKIVAL